MDILVLLSDTVDFVSQGLDDLTAGPIDQRDVHLGDFLLGSLRERSVFNMVITGILVVAFKLVDGVVFENRGIDQGRFLLDLIELCLARLHDVLFILAHAGLPKL